MVSQLATTTQGADRWMLIGFIFSGTAMHVVRCRATHGQAGWPQLNSPRTSGNRGTADLETLLVVAARR
jgi:hypothetical protein